MSCCCCAWYDALTSWPAIVGGIVAVVVLGASVTAGVLFWLRRRSVARPGTSHRETEVLHTRDEWLIVRRMPLDGNSLFAALAHQMFRGEVGSRQHREQTATLRALAVQHLRENTKNYHNEILRAVKSNISRYKKHSQDRERITHYLGDLASSGFPGGDECLSALADALSAEVWLYRVGGSKFIFRPCVVQQGVDLPIARLASRLARHPDGATRTHYDSVLATSPLVGSHPALPAPS